MSKYSSSNGKAEYSGLLSLNPGNPIQFLKKKTKRTDLPGVAMSSLSLEH